MKIIYKTSIDCAHHIPDSDELLTKKCSKLHGHTYNFEVLFDLPSLKKYWKREFVDFAFIKDYVETILSKYDHQNLDDFKIYTVEQLALIIKASLITELKWQNEDALTVRIMETAKFGVEC